MKFAIFQSIIFYSCSRPAFASIMNNQLQTLLFLQSFTRDQYYNFSLTVGLLSSSANKQTFDHPI